MIGYYCCKSDLPNSCHFFTALPWALATLSSFYHRSQDHLPAWPRQSSKRCRVLLSVLSRRRSWWEHQIIVLLLKNRQCLPFYHFTRNWKTYSRSIVDRIKSPFWKGLPGPNLGLDLPYILGLCWNNHHCLPTLYVCVSPTQSSSIWYRNESPLFWAVGFQ